jgi:ferredoxin
MAMYVDPAACNGCGACVDVCPNDAIRLVSGKAVMDQEKCAACAVCVDACPTHAITEGAPLVVIPEPVQPVAKHPTVIVPAQQEPARTSSTWLGMALTFVGREIVPRLLDVLEQRLLSPAQSPAVSSSSKSNTNLPGQRETRQTGGPKGRGLKRRRRRYQGNYSNSRNERR